MLWVSVTISILQTCINKTSKNLTKDLVNQYLLASGTAPTVSKLLKGKHATGQNPAWVWSSFHLYTHLPQMLLANFIFPKHFPPVKNSCFQYEVTYCRGLCTGWRFLGDADMLLAWACIRCHRRSHLTHTLGQTRPDTLDSHTLLDHLVLHNVHRSHKHEICMGPWHLWGREIYLLISFI